MLHRGIAPKPASLLGPQTSGQRSICIATGLLPWALGLIAASALPGCSGSAPSETRGVLLISVDSLRADHVSSYGYQSPTRPEIDTTPVIDRLLSLKGTRFTRAYSTTSWTLPAHMALMTGLPNELHGVRGIPDQLHPTRPYLPQLLKDAGWRTAGFWSGPNLHPYFGFERGFELYEDCSSRKITDTAVFDPQDELEFEKTVEMHESSHEGITGPALVNAFESWFEKLEKDERFFAFVHMWDVHYDYNAPPEHDLFDPNYRGDIDGQGFTELELRSPKTPRGLADLNRLIALYDAEIHFTDHNVGRLLDVLSSSGRADNTLVIFLSDHGEEFLEHEALGHKHSLFEESVLVPLIMRLPEVIPANRSIDEVVCLTDIAPTILELTGVPIPENMWGRSIVPAIDGDSLPERILPLELSFKPLPEIWRTTVDGFVKVNDVPTENRKHREKLFVYDLAKDPGENEPIFVHRNQPTREVAAAEALWRELDAQAAELPVVIPESPMPDQLEHDLGDSGYIDTTDKDDRKSGEDE